MSLLTKKQCYERLWLQQTMVTVTKVEPEQLAAKIHDCLIFLQRKELNNNDIIDEFKDFLNRVTVETVSGDNVDGWRTRTKYLTTKQKETIGRWVELVYMLGGRFDDFNDEDLN